MSYHPNNRKNEYTTKEIAEALGITTTQVMKAERSALRKLAVWLNGLDRP